MECVCVCVCVCVCMRVCVCVCVVCVCACVCVVYALCVYVRVRVCELHTIAWTNMLLLGHQHNGYGVACGVKFTPKSNKIDVILVASCTSSSFLLYQCSMTSFH